MEIVAPGGAGKMGCIAVQYLAGDQRVDEVVIADWDVAQARTVAGIINSTRVSIKSVDVTGHDALVGTLKGADACLNATVYYFNLQVMGACLEAGVSYTDMGGLFHTTRKQSVNHPVTCCGVVCFFPHFWYHKASFLQGRGACAGRAERHRRAHHLL